MSRPDLLALLRDRRVLVSAAAAIVLLAVLVWPRVVLTSTEPTVTKAQMWLENGADAGYVTDEQLALAGVARDDAVVLTLELEWSHPVSVLGLARQCTSEHAGVLVDGSWRVVWADLGAGQTIVETTLGKDQFIAVDLEPGAERALSARFVADLSDPALYEPWQPVATAQIGWPCQPGPTDWGHGVFDVIAPPVE